MPGVEGARAVRCDRLASRLKRGCTGLGLTAGGSCLLRGLNGTSRVLGCDVEQGEIVGGCGKAFGGCEVDDVCDWRLFRDPFQAHWQEILRIRVVEIGRAHV